MLDLHTHILPGIDDGPADVAEALELAQACVADGVTTVVATPHAFCTLMDVSPDQRDAALSELLAELRKRKICLDILPGFECRIVDDLVQRICQEPRYLLPPDIAAAVGEPHVLIELDEDAPIACANSVLFELQLHGITPILAHPERHPDTRRKQADIEAFVANGGKLQITATALTGEEGWRTRHLCERLVRKGLVSSIASDAHSAEDVGAMTEARDRMCRLNLKAGC